MAPMSDKVKRRLTTVLCADVHGYSRLMEADEAGTLETLRRYRTAMKGLVERHDGRIVNTWGDAVIAEFSSVVEAVQCAVEIQQEVPEQDTGSPEAPRMQFRIGINLGDVMVEGSDIYGDGVNIAARLQEFAEPGDVLVSGSVYDQVYNKLSLGFDCLGQQQMKNLATPVMSYRVSMGGRAGGRRRFSARESSRFQTDEVAQARARSILDGHRLPRRPVSDWFANLPRPIAAILVISGFLFLINVLSGLHRIWFHWPAATLLLIAVLIAVFRRKRVSDRMDDRRNARR
jgi:adenylate cyclase